MPRSGPGPQLVVGPERGRQDEPPRGDRPARPGPLAPDGDRRRADPLGRGRRPRRGPAPARTTIEVRAASGRAPRRRRRRRAQADPGQRRRRAGRPALVGVLRAVLFAPEEMLLVVGSPSLRRATLDELAGPALPGLRRRTSRPTGARSSSGTASCGRSARSRRSRTELRFWDAPFLDAGGGGRRGAAAPPRRPGRAARRGPRRDRAGRGGGRPRSALRYVTNAPALPGESARDALARRLAETAEKEVWNGTTLVGPAPRRPRLRARRPRPGRRSPRAASSGPRSWPSSSPSSTSLTAHDGRPPLLLLDDVFSELDPARRAHLVRRIAELPQAFVTTTTLDDLDPALRGRDRVGGRRAGECGAVARRQRRASGARPGGRPTCDAG